MSEEVWLDSVTGPWDTAALIAAGGGGSSSGDGSSDWPWPWGALGLNPWLTLAMALISFISEGLYGATSFGPAITFNVGWQLCFMLGLSDGTLTSVAIDMTVMETCSAALQIILLRKQIDPWLALAISLPCVVCTYIGQELMIRLDGPGLKLALAAILFSMTSQRVWANWGRAAPKADRPKPAGLDLKNPRTLASICFWFSVAGTMGGITSIGGPPMMLFVSFHAADIDLSTWRGSNAVLRLALNLSRGAVFVETGRLQLAAHWPLDLGMVAGAWTGLMIGNACAGFFRDADALHWWMVSFLFYASLLMAAAGGPIDIQRQASVVVGVRFSPSIYDDFLHGNDREFWLNMMMLCVQR